MRSLSAYLVIVLESVALQACAVSLPAVPESVNPQGPLVVGRAVTVLTGERSRIYLPAVRWFEIRSRETGERYTVHLGSSDERFMLSLATGDYELTRIQVSEGPFLSMAQLHSVFRVESDALTSVGTWRFGIDSPGYGRMVSVSMVNDEQDRSEKDEAAKPRLAPEGMAVALAVPEPAEIRTRLYEVAPYPRYPRYFRRHWW